MPKQKTPRVGLAVALERLGACYAACDRAGAYHTNYEAALAAWDSSLDLAWLMQRLAELGHLDAALAARTMVNLVTDQGEHYYDGLPPRLQTLWSDLVAWEGPSTPAAIDVTDVTIDWLTDLAATNFVASAYGRALRAVAQMANGSTDPEDSLPMVAYRAAHASRAAGDQSLGYDDAKRHHTGVLRDAIGSELIAAMDRYVGPVPA